MATLVRLVAYAALVTAAVLLCLLNVNERRNTNTGNSVRFVGSFSSQVRSAMTQRRKTADTLAVRTAEAEAEPTASGPPQYVIVSRPAAASASCCLESVVSV